MHLHVNVHICACEFVIHPFVNVCERVNIYERVGNINFTYVRTCAYVSKNVHVYTYATNFFFEKLY